MFLKTTYCTALTTLSFFSSVPLPAPLRQPTRRPKPATSALLTLDGPRDCVYCIAFDPDGDRVAAASKDGLVKVWDAHTGKDVAVCKGHAGHVLRLAFSPDGKTLATAGADKTVRLWNPATGAELRKFQGHINWVAGLAFSPDGKQLVTGMPTRPSRFGT